MSIVQNIAGAQKLLAGGLIAAAMLSASAASAATPAPTQQQSCFFITQWEGWHAPNPNTLYLRVSMHDIYRVDLSSGTDMLQWPDVHLISKVHGGDSVCNALDLDLEVSDGHGFREPLFLKTITKLSPTEVAAIPKKDRP